MFSLFRRSKPSRTTRRPGPARCALRLEALEERTVLARVNYALNLSGVGFPSPALSDSGWGGGNQPRDVLDGRVAHTDTWMHGLAFTGGAGAYGGQPAGLRQATIDFGATRTFQQVVVWHHGDAHVPATNDPRTTSLEFWDGAAWRNLSFARSYDSSYLYNGWGASPDYYTFSAVTGSRVRYTIDNRLNNVLGTQLEHGWIYELEVWSEAAPAMVTPLQQRFFGGTSNDTGTGIAVTNTGSDYAVYLSGVATSATLGDEGQVVNYRVPYALNTVTAGWNRSWPGAANRDDFNGIAATSSDVFAAGSSWSRTTDTVGSKENKGITVRFPPTGGAPTWERQTPGAPGAFIYGGWETLLDVTTAVEAGQTYLYATGMSQSGFSSYPGRLYLSKLTSSGTVLWTRTDPVADPDSAGNRVVAAGGAVYVAGFTEDSGTRQAYLKKYDPNGVLLWSRVSIAGAYNGVTVDVPGNALYAVGWTSGTNFLVEKWNLNGLRLWSQSLDRNGAEDILNGAALLGGQLYAVGSTRGTTLGGSDGVVLQLDPVTGMLNGTTLWGGSGEDVFRAVAVTSNGLHVAGTTSSFGSGGTDQAYVLYRVAPPVLPAVRFTLSAPATVTAGSAFTVTVTARDTLGNVAPSYRGTVTFSSTDSQAVLPANYVFTAADAGTHTFSATLRTAGSRSVTARDLVTAAITGSATVNVLPAAAVWFLVSLPDFSTAGASFSVTVSARDTYNNVATAYRGTVAFSSTDSQATLPVNYAFTAADAGTHTFSATMRTAGSRTVSVRDTVLGFLTGSDGFGVIPAAASRFDVSAPASRTAGEPFSVTVTARDPYSNVATGYRGTVALSSTDYAAALPANYTFTAADAGAHVFADVTLYFAGSQTVTAADAGNPSLSGTATVTVNPAAASWFYLYMPETVTAGTPFDLYVFAVDAYGNLDTNYAGTVAFFTSSDPAAVLPQNYTFTAADQGVARMSVTFFTEGTHDLWVYDVDTVIYGLAYLSVLQG